MRVLGSSGTYPTPENACSGYLFSAEGFNLQVDFGPGTFVNMHEHLAPIGLDAVLLTHWHPDHCIDIYPLFYALRFHPDHPTKLPVYAPAGAESHLFAFLSGDSQEEFRRVFDFREIDASSALEVGPFNVSLARTEHPVETMAVSVEEGGRRVAYSSDTGPGGGFPELARAADVVLCESTYEYVGQGPPIHLAASQAGEIANQAEVGELLLTHIFPTCDSATCLEHAKSEYSGPIDLVKQGDWRDL